MSENKNIAKAFVLAQKDFSPALKTASNPFFKSKYADLSACVEAVIDALNANGIALMQHCSESDTGVIVETVFLHESGEMLHCGKLHVPAAKNDPQGYGSALTYARRYSLMAACGIAPEDDDGNAASNKKYEQVDTKPIRQKYVDRAVEVYRECVEADVEEIDTDKMQDVNAQLTNDERIEVMNVLKPLGKMEGTNRAYTTIVNECLKAHPADNEEVEK